MLGLLAGDSWSILPPSRFAEKTAANGALVCFNFELKGSASTRSRTVEQL